ncbi:MAG: heat shock protein HspQ [Planctomycetota bacterium]
MPQPEPPAEVPDFFPDELPRLQTGDCVTHRRYGYLGVVVDFDMSCRASDDWYRRNRTQPRRDQPWYHILVSGSTGNTYVAQDNLEPLPNGAAVVHPLLADFFTVDAEGHYLRNDALWPAWD